MGLEGVEGVVDRLRVRPSAVMTDKEIKKHLDDLIAGEPALKGLGIKAEVRDGVIDLEGEAPSLTHKRLAGVLAWWVPGSTDVINSLELNTLEEDTDSELADAVLSALEKDVLVGGYSITVNAKGFAVTLEGSVCSEAEKEAAEDDAWYVWGVNEVVNRLAVRRTLACRTPKRPAAG
ncbi:MAG: BON domain-containing protein [Deltaproteobacteria bacterium]|nr:BON domain-containing protein [Deltaproteobacteria bacterium]